MDVLHGEAGAGGPGECEGLLPVSGPVPQQTRRSRRRVQYRASGWRVHQWEVRAGGEALCRAAAVRTGGGALLLWVGGAGCAGADLGAVALGVPAERPGGGALCSLLAGGGGGGAEGGAALARRLATALRRPVTVCCSLPFDRFTAPLVERGLVAEIKSRPDYFVETK